MQSNNFVPGIFILHLFLPMGRHMNGQPSGSFFWRSGSAASRSATNSSISLRERGQFTNDVSTQGMGARAKDSA